MTEDEMVGWHHRFYGHEFEEALGVGDGQGSLANFSFSIFCMQADVETFQLSH